MSVIDQVEIARYVERRKEVLHRVRRLLQTSLNLSRELDEIDPDTALFGTGLGIDSIDAVEIIIALESELRVRIEDPQERKLVLRSVNSLVDRILAAEKVEVAHGA
ncbi:MAG TPA: phosphopantetheine-binding protein [Myxococcales bacterium]|nr:phosphopantetheine-binding protein [Myxococcales bacterium]